MFWGYSKILSIMFLLTLQFIHINIVCTKVERIIKYALNRYSEHYLFVAFREFLNIDKGHAKYIGPCPLHATTHN